MLEKFGLGKWEGGKKREGEKEKDKEDPPHPCWSLSQLGSSGSSGLCAACRAIRPRFQSRAQWILGLIDAVAWNVSKSEKRKFDISLTFCLTGA